MIASGANGPITIIEQVQTPVEEEFSESDDDHSETNWPYRILPLLRSLRKMVWHLKWTFLTLTARRKRIMSQMRVWILCNSQCHLLHFTLAPLSFTLSDKMLKETQCSVCGQLVEGSRKGVMRRQGATGILKLFLDILRTDLIARQRSVSNFQQIS